MINIKTSLAIALIAASVSLAGGMGQTSDETSRTLQAVLDSQYEWLRKIRTMEVTVQTSTVLNSDDRFNETNSSATLWISGDRFRLEKVSHETTAGGKPEIRNEVIVFDGDTYYRFSPYFRWVEEARIADRNKFPNEWNNPFNYPYGATRLPFLHIYSFAQPETQMLSALQKRELWKSSRFQVKTINREMTEHGPVTHVPFIFDHAGRPSLVESTIRFAEQYGNLPSGFNVKVIDKTTSAILLQGDAYQLSCWTRLPLDERTSVTLPLRSALIDRAKDNSYTTAEILHVQPDDIRFNHPIPDSVFIPPPVPPGYKRINVLTGETLTTDTETLKRWNDYQRLLSCDECAETTAPEYLPKGDLDVVVRLEGNTSQSLEGYPYRLYYRYGNCCVLFKEGVVSSDQLIPLDAIPGKRHQFTYPLYIGSTHVTTIEPATSGTITVKVPPMVRQNMPDYHLTDIRTSETTSIGKFSGKRLVIEFWGINCAPCLPAIKKLNTFASGLDHDQSQNVEFLTITGRHQENAVRKFLTDNGLNSLRHYWAADETYSFLGSNGIPCTVLVDESGKIAWRGNPGDEGYEKALHDLVSRQ